MSRYGSFAQIWSIFTLATMYSTVCTFPTYQLAPNITCKNKRTTYCCLSKYATNLTCVQSDWWIESHTKLTDGIIGHEAVLGLIQPSLYNLICSSMLYYQLKILMSLFSHLELIDSLQFLEVRDESRSILQCAQKLHLELQHLRKVPEQHVQLKHAPHTHQVKHSTP